MKIFYRVLRNILFVIIIPLITVNNVADIKPSINQINYVSEPLDEFLTMKLRDSKEQTFKKLKDLEKDGKVKNIIESKGEYIFNYEFKEVKNSIEEFGICSFNKGKLYNIHLEVINDKYQKAVEKIYQSFRKKYNLNETKTKDDIFAERQEGNNEMTLIFYVFEGQANLIIDFIAKEIEVKK
jgi:hypothetical protein